MRVADLLAERECAGETLILELPASGFAGRLVNPYARLPDLTTNRQPYAIGLQTIRMDIGIHAESLVRVGGRLIPIRLDDAAEWVGGSKGHEGQSVQNTTPREYIDAGWLARSP
jgi:hypothetical protein